MPWKPRPRQRCRPRPPSQSRPAFAECAHANLCRSAVPRSRRLRLPKHLLRLRLTPRQRCRLRPLSQSRLASVGCAHANWFRSVELRSRTLTRLQLPRHVRILKTRLTQHDRRLRKTFSRLLQMMSKHNVASLSLRRLREQRRKLVSRPRQGRKSRHLGKNAAAPALVGLLGLLLLSVSKQQSKRNALRRRLQLRFKPFSAATAAVDKPRRARRQSRRRSPPRKFKQAFEACRRGRRCRKRRPRLRVLP
mmetsp:Transcript_2933/g.8849  ORF Transcript_2933/g.8849 Transcript_2933/m.8849 type:complete len:249 (-) Transcript_2933:953-1699(-)